MIDLNKLCEPFASFKKNKPFDFCIVDNFFNDDIATQLSQEFPSFESPIWYEYKNSIEIKKACNNWNVFPETTYQTFSFLNSRDFLSPLEKLTGIANLYPDPGLNGGGWHIHASGGKLNPHLDYSIHPKLSLQRKINVIVYLEHNWEESWGGHLGLYTHDNIKKSPKELSIEILPKFNRAVFFDTTQDSWHGLCQTVRTPENICRKSIAAYFLTEPPQNAETRGKALFAPTKEQEDDEKVLELIQKRSQINTAASTWKT